jgi:hypothetical protein
MDIHTVDPQAPEPLTFETEIATEILRRYKSPDTDHTPAELIQAGGETLCSEIHELVNSIWNKEELPQQRKVSTVVPTYKTGNKTDNCRGISLSLTSYRRSSNILLSE